RPAEVSGIPAEMLDPPIVAPLHSCHSTRPLRFPKYTPAVARRRFGRGGYDARCCRYVSEARPRERDATRRKSRDAREGLRHLAVLHVAGLLRTRPADRPRARLARLCPR